MRLLGVCVLLLLCLIALPSETTNAVTLSCVDARILSGKLIASGDIDGASRLLEGRQCSDVQLLNNLAFVLQSQRRRNEGIEALHEAEVLDPQHSGTQCNLANALRTNGTRAEKEQALLHARRATELDPRRATYSFALAATHHELGAIEAASALYHEILRRPDLSTGLAARCHRLAGRALVELGQAERAREHFDQAVLTVRSGTSNPDSGHSEALCRRAVTRRQLLEWRYSRQDEHIVRAFLATGRPCLQPAQSLLLDLSPELVKGLAIEVARRAASRAAHLQRAERPAGLHVMYISSDLRDHTTGHLLLEILRHQSVPATVYSLGHGHIREGDSWTRAIANHTVSRNIATVHEESTFTPPAEVTLLVDLNGFSPGGQPDLVAAFKTRLPTISALEYSSTLGGTTHYLLGDLAAMSPQDQHDEMAEALVALPHTLFPGAGAARAVAGPQDSIGRPPEALDGVRGFLQLNPSTMLLGCFSDLVKLSPRIFSGVWMNILRSSTAALWLQLPQNALPHTASNLRAEMSAQGILSTRLVLSAKAARAVHLSIKAAADLFLDTITYGAHMTAADALWAGLPLIAMPESKLVSRISFSLLKALGMLKLSVSSLKEYESFVHEMEM